MQSAQIVLKPIHPFPARMAAEIAFQELKPKDNRLRVLDPMAGSGTTLAVAVRHGHHAVGFDTDPLAVLMASVWCAKVDPKTIQDKASVVLKRATAIADEISLRLAYPRGCTDSESKRFLRYWFDSANRRKLYALSETIRRLRNEEVKTVLWCAFSRMIIKKSGGVSLAMDVPHSRPHKVTSKSKADAFLVFEDAVRQLLRALNNSSPIKGKVRMRIGDARQLPLRRNSIDLVITSPPYLNAIDYMRGHKLSLVWMGYSIPQLRGIRGSNVGCERSRYSIDDETITTLKTHICSHKHLPSRLTGMIHTYLEDLHSIISEIERVLAPGGKVVFVVGNSNFQGIFIRNSLAVRHLAEQCGLKLVKSTRRNIPANRRYMPPPSKGATGIRNRMKTEALMTFVKTE